ncbi:lasso peptide biosynthesis PqqD family chaperone [Streptomyces sp. NPDC048290]|uniref:lasso peptide biosynthesis PqqD family chaperone n=1 Tax=Streptomyces sp. NPDC048290 TaxID=3155811 RepID=UPI00342A86A0
MPLRINPDFTLTETDDSAVLLNERTGGYWQLNPTGARVLGDLLAGRTEEETATGLADAYGIPRERAVADVAHLLDRLRAQGAVR